MRADGWERSVRFRVDAFLVIATHAGEGSHITVDFDDVLRTGGDVKAVDVLRQRPDSGKFLLQQSDDFVGLG